MSHLKRKDKGWMTEVSYFDYRNYQCCWLYLKLSRRTVQSTLPPLIFPSGTAAGLKAHNSPLSSTKFKSDWNCTSINPICLHGVHRNTFTSICG